MSLLQKYVDKTDSVFDDTEVRFRELEQINDYLVEKDAEMTVASPLNKFELDYMWRWFSNDNYSAGFIGINLDTLEDFCKWITNEKGEI